jgi:hypothetical protein
MMGTDGANPYLRGIIVPDMRTTPWDTESGEYATGTRISAIQSASPEAGIPAPGRTTAMGLRASGPQTATLYVQCTRGGLPDVDEVGLQWSDTGVAGTYRGCDLPNVIWRFEHLQAGTYNSPHVISTPDGTAILVYYNAAANRIETRTRNATTHVWAAAVTVVAAGADPHPCLVRLPPAPGNPLATGRVLLYGWRQVTASAHQVQMWYSDDNGATWTSGGDVLAVTVDTSVYTSQLRLRAGYLAGQILLVAHLRLAPPGTGAYVDCLQQWSSSDGGMTFGSVTVQANTVGSHGGWHEVLVDGAVFLVGWLYEDDDKQDIACKWVRLASASDSITAALGWGATTDTDTGLTLGVATALGGGDVRIDFGELAAEVDDDGAICMFVRHEDTGACPVLRSADGGQTWRGTGTSARYTSLGQNWWDHQSTNEWAEDFCCCRLHGRVLLVTSWYTGGADTNDLACLYLGGWQTVTMPLRNGAVAPYQRVAWEYPAVATHTPGLVAGAPWTNQTAGGGVVSYAAGVVTVSAPGALDQAYADAVPVATAGQGIMGEWCLTWTSGSLYHRIQLVTGGGASYCVEIRWDGTNLILYDLRAPGVIVSLPWTSGAAVRLRLAVAQVGGAGYCRAWVCKDDAATEDRVWTAIGSSVALASGGPGANYIMFGAYVTGVGTYREWPFTAGAYTGDQWVQTQTSALQYPRSITDEGTYAQFQTLLSAVTGPAAPGDTWTITPTAEYPPTNLLPTLVRSPRHPWRSRAFSPGGSINNIRLSWTISPYHTTSEGGMSDLWGVWLDGVNCGAPALYLYYSGAWNLVATGITDTFSSRRDGSSFYAEPGGATSGSYTWRRGELDGAGYETGAAGGFTNSLYRGKIDQSYPGSTRTNSGTSVIYKHISQNAVGGMGTTQTTRLWPRRHLFLVRLSAFARYVRGFQIRLTVPTAIPQPPPGIPYDGYYQIGKVVAGPVWVWGADYSWGRSVSYDPNQEIAEADDGTRIIRVKGPVRRSVELSWADGTDISRVVSNAAPDYTTGATGGDPLAFLEDTPLEIADEIRQLQGAGTPVVYLPYIPRGGTGGATRWGQGAIYGCISDAIALEQVVGEEEDTDVLRVSRLTISEEV